MSHRLDISEATLQRVGGSKRRRSRDAACELNAWTALLIAPPSRAGGPAFCSSEWISPSTHSATLRSGVERSKRPERRIASARPADLRRCPFLQQAARCHRSLGPASSVTSSSARRATPAAASGCRTPPRPRPGVDTAGLDSAIPAEVRHHRKGPGPGHVHVGHGDVVAAQAAPLPMTSHVSTISHSSLGK